MISVSLICQREVALFTEPKHARCLHLTSIHGNIKNSERLNRILKLFFFSNTQGVQLFDYGNQSDKEQLSSAELLWSIPPTNRHRKRNI